MGESANPKLQCYKCGKWRRLNGKGTFLMNSDEYGNSWCVRCQKEFREEYDGSLTPKKGTNE